MDKLRDKINSLRAEAEAANERADTAEDALKKFSNQQTEREQELVSLQNRIALLEAEADRRDAQLSEAKQLQKDSEATLNQSDVLVRKVDTLEDKLDSTETQLRDALENARRLDLENEKLQRTIIQHEKDKERLELKYENLHKDFAEAKDELERTLNSLSDL
ncbi:tropomyosin-2 [Coemansia sp. RSA 376]|nr:tropomyosin-2 [Coemansia sp. S680]KAJ2028728.1 tropomyosin-2 [Coemansia sp. S3946]KAJ2042396.1 tropomyosin-2 [Coemansia sp. S16]KAJ2259224.1 tropomyosin-2 [Coemansia sp. RSA 455]KAJ2260014.1 tropomyosin-2 [Coemansia sp. RSA 376]